MKSKLNVGLGLAFLAATAMSYEAPNYRGGYSHEPRQPSGKDRSNIKRARKQKHRKKPNPRAEVK